MDENKLSFNKKFKLIVQKQFLQKEPCSWGEQGFKLPPGATMFSKKKKLLLLKEMIVPCGKKGA